MVRCRRYRGRPGEFLCKTNVFDKAPSRGVTDPALERQARVLCCRFLESMQSVGLDLVVSVDMSTGGGGMDSKCPRKRNDISSPGRVSLIINPGCSSSSLVSVHVVLCSSCLIARRSQVDIALTVVCSTITSMDGCPSPVSCCSSAPSGARSSHCNRSTQLRRYTRHGATSCNSLFIALQNSGAASSDNHHAPCRPGLHCFERAEPSSIYKICLIRFNHGSRLNMLCKVALENTRTILSKVLSLTDQKR